MAKTKSEKETSAAAVKVLEELTADEERERHRLEHKVEKAFYEAGVALRELRDKRLYRSTHKTFEQYCRDRFNYSRDTADLKIAASVVYDNIQKFLPTICRQTPMPNNECQLRALAKADLEPETQANAWIQSVESAGGKLPSGRVVKGVVERLKEKPLRLASDFCEVGDVFILKGLVESERKYNGCWAITSDTSGITVGVDVHDSSLRVSEKNLKRIDSPEVHRQLPAILERIRRLRNSGMLDRCAYTILESLGRQTYLTDFEADLLRFMEQRYGINEHSSPDNC